MAAPDALGTFFHQHIGCHADRAGRIDHVVHDDYVAAFTSPMAVILPTILAFARPCAR